MVYKDQDEMFAHVTVGMEQRIRLLSEQQAAITIKRLRYTEVTYGRFNIFGVDRVEGTVLWKLPTKVKAPLKSAAVQPVDFSLVYLQQAAHAVRLIPNRRLSGPNVRRWLNLFAMVSTICLRRL